MHGTDTAHEAWDQNWQTEAVRAQWLTPDERVLGCAASLHDRGFRKALDLGCGVGRHALALAEQGFEVDALDGSPAGLDQLAASAAERGLDIRRHLGRMHDLPFEAGAFDYVLAFNVIYHGDPAIVGGTVREIERVLRPGGVFQGTLLSKRNVNFGVGEEIAADTFVVPGASDDKVHPHFYCGARELVALLEGFELLSLEDDEQKPGHWHWHFVAERR